ncbi:MAG: sialate O-acetylesterase, partial [Sandaracinobacteroides sp.]
FMLGFAVLALIFAGPASASGQPVDLYVFAGQSNMLGSVSALTTESTGPSLIPEPYRSEMAGPLTWARIWNNENAAPNALIDGPKLRFGTQFVPYRAAINPFSGRPGRWGPEVAFLSARHAATGETLNVLKYAVGGTALYYSPTTRNWNVQAVGDKSLLNALSERVNRASAALLAEGHSSVRIRFHWAQGESDAGAFGKVYSQNFASMVSALRLSVEQPNVSFSLESLTLVANASSRNAQAAQLIAATEAATQVVNVNGFPVELTRSDKVHLNAEGQIRHGVEMELVSRTKPRSFADRTGEAGEQLTVRIPVRTGPLLALPTLANGSVGLAMRGDVSGLSLDALTGTISVTDLAAIQPGVRDIIVGRHTAFAAEDTRLRLTFVR